MNKGTEMGTPGGFIFRFYSYYILSLSGVTISVPRSISTSTSMFKSVSIYTYLCLYIHMYSRGA